MTDSDRLLELQKQRKEIDTQIRLLRHQISQTTEEKMTCGCVRMQHDTSKVGCGTRKDEWLVQIKCVTGKDNPRKRYDKYSTIIFNTDKGEAINSIDTIISDLQGLKKNIFELDGLNNE